MHKQRQRALKMTKFVISFAFFVFILGKGLPEKLHFRGKGTLLLCQYNNNNPCFSLCYQ